MRSRAPTTWRPSTKRCSRAPLPREQAVAIGERAVQFYEEWFDDPARVVRILERVLEIDPTADWAFDRLKLVLDAAERWDDLFALYDRALESATGKKRATLLEDAAQTAKDFADRPDRAIRYLEQLQELKPGDTKLAGSLERLYERQGKHRELVSLLSARLPRCGPTRRAARARASRPSGSTSSARRGGARDHRAPARARRPGGERRVGGVGPARARAGGRAPGRRVAAIRRCRREARHARRSGRESPRFRRLVARLGAAARRGVAARSLRRDEPRRRPRADAPDRARERCAPRRSAFAATSRSRISTRSSAISPSALEQTGLAVVHAPEDDATARQARRARGAHRAPRPPAPICSPPPPTPARGAVAQDRAPHAGRQRARRRASDALARRGALLSSSWAAKGCPARPCWPQRASSSRCSRRRAARGAPRRRRAHRVRSRREPVAKRDAARAGGEPGGAARAARAAIALWETRVNADERDAEALDGLVDLLDRVADSETARAGARAAGASVDGAREPARRPGARRRSSWPT